MGVMLNGTEYIMKNGVQCIVQNCSDVFIEKCMSVCDSFNPLTSVMIVSIFFLSILKIAVEKWFTEKAGQDLREKLNWTFIGEGWLTTFRDIVLYNCDLVIFLFSLIMSYSIISSLFV